MRSGSNFCGQQLLRRQRKKWTIKIEGTKQKPETSGGSKTTSARCDLGMRSSRKCNEQEGATAPALKKNDVRGKAEESHKLGGAVCAPRAGEQPGLRSVPETNIARGGGCKTRINKENQVRNHWAEESRKWGSAENRDQCKISDQHSARSTTTTKRTRASHTISRNDFFIKSLNKIHNRTTKFATISLSFDWKLKLFLAHSYFRKYEIKLGSGKKSHPL
jgi:hypothetical protein